jgi:DNA-binding NarL/FixJ family response regulator
LKSEANRQLSSAVEALLLHKPFFGGAVAEKLLVTCLATNTTQVNSLTPRERMVVQLISEGHSNKSMSEVLNLSVKTIETHRASAMHRLSVKSTAALVRYAIKNMFIQP